MGTLSGPPASPEQLFAEYHALRADPAATRDSYDALGKKTRAAKAAWTKLGDRVRRQQLTDLQNYITQFRPVEASRLLTTDSFARELASLRASVKTVPPAALESAARILWRRLEETRAHLALSADYDEDHDEFIGGEGEILDLAHELGIDLSAE